MTAYGDCGRLLDTDRIMAHAALDDAPIEVTVPHAERLDSHVVYKVVVRHGEPALVRNALETLLHACLLQEGPHGSSLGGTANSMHCISR